MHILHSPSLYLYAYFILHITINRKFLSTKHRTFFFLPKQSFTNRISQTFSVSFPDRYLISEMVGRHSHPQTSCRAKTRCNFQDTIVHFHFPRDPSLRAHTESRNSPVRAESYATTSSAWGSARLRARTTIAVVEPRKKSCTFKTNRPSENSPDKFLHTRTWTRISALTIDASSFSSPWKDRTSLELVVNCQYNL